MDWRELYFGHVSPAEVQEAIKDATWQKLRKEMKGRALDEMLRNYYLAECCEDPRSLRLLQVRVTNYVTALSRGGLIKPSDYR